MYLRASSTTVLMIHSVTALALLCLASSATSVPLRRVVCHRAASGIDIDGQLNEPAWSAASVTGALHEVFQKEERDTLVTRVRVLWDDENLYVGFTGLDDDIFATYAEEDSALWEEEVFEVFIDPDGDGQDYTEFEINPLGAVIDLLLPDNRHIPDWREWARWDCEGLRGAVHVDGTVDDRTDRDRRWAAELAIPFASLPPFRAAPAVGDVWRIQFFRIDRPAGEEAPHCLAWCPTPVFHYPKRFGEIEFAP